MKKLIFYFVVCLTSNIFSQEIKFGNVSKEELEEQFYPLDSVAEASFLYKKKQISFEYDGNNGWSIITKVHERVKIYNKEGFDYSNKTIKLFHTGGRKEKVSRLKAYTYFLDSKGRSQKVKLTKEGRFKEEKNKNWTYKKLVMPKIKEGVIIELSYQITSPFHWNIDQIIVQESIPVKKLEISVRIPEYFVFKNFQRGFYPIKIIKTSKNRNIDYSFRKQKDEYRSARTIKYSNSVDLVENIISIKEENIPALKKQTHVFNIDNYRTSLLFELSYVEFPNNSREFYSTTWEDVSKKIYKSSRFGDELDKINYFKNDIAPVLQNAQSDAQKIAAIFTFVKSKVRWNGNYGKYVENGVKKAYKIGSGNVADINLMLTSMLRFAGLNSNPVLISSVEHGIPLFPTIEGYNYVVTSITFQDNSYMVLDASELYSIPNILPVRALNWYGRIVQKDGKSKEIKLLPKKHSTKNNYLNIKIKKDLTIEGMLRVNLTDHLAMKYRQNNNHINKEDLTSKLEEKYAVDIQNIRVNNVSKLRKPVVLSLKFSSEDFLEEINDKLYISPLFFLRKKKNPFKASKREFPVDFGLRWTEKENINISIPEGYKVESLPSQLAIGLPENLGTFKYQIINKGNKIKVVSIFKINAIRISSAYYLDLKEFYNKVVEKQTEKIVLIKK